MKDISEILEREDRVVKLPDHIGQKYDKSTKTGSWVTSGAEELKEDMEYLKSWKVYGDLMSKQPGGIFAGLRDPTATLALLGGYIRLPVDPLGDALTSLNGITKSIGYDFLSQNKGTVPIPPHFSGENMGLFKWSVDTMKNRTPKLLGIEGVRTRPNYGAILISRTNSGEVNKLINKLTEDAFKKEFEKGRTPFKLPKSKEYEKLVRLYETKKKPPKTPKSLLETIKDRVIDEMTGTIDKYGTEGYKVLENKAEIDRGVSHWKRVESDYFNFNDPYESSIYKFEENSTFENVISKLNSEGFLSSYRDFSGFEMGSDHLWSIKLLPYPYDDDDVQAFKEMGRKSITPPLPCYVLPNMWRETRVTTSSAEHDGIRSKVIQIGRKWIAKALDVEEGSIPEETIVDELSNAVPFSFSHNTPVLSYDLTLGSMKPESLRLFNGGSSEFFAGMSYNAVMSMSILDDVYGSMKKYMNTYINAAYDIDTHSLAPYYSMAFQIELTILRAGGQINHRHKFIGVPFEYTPRFDGSQDSNETRIDLTFGIIGYKYPKKGKGTELYINNMGGRASIDKTDLGKEKKFSLGSLTWGDITLNMGQNVDS